MNACACAAGAAKTAATATVAAINFEFMSVILPRIWSGNWTDRGLRSTHPNDARDGQLRVRRVQEPADPAGICGARQGRQFAGVTPEWRSRPALAARVEAIQ